MSIELSIWEAILAANRAWREGRPEDVASLFHRDVVMEAPDGRTVCRGREAMVQSFVEYTRAVDTLHFRETDYDVHVAASTAVVSYGFEVIYEESRGSATRRAGESASSSCSTVAFGLPCGGCRRPRRDRSEASAPRSP